MATQPSSSTQSTDQRAQARAAARRRRDTAWT